MECLFWFSYVCTHLTYVLIFNMINLLIYYNYTMLKGAWLFLFVMKHRKWHQSKHCAIDISRVQNQKPSCLLTKPSLGPFDLTSNGSPDATVCNSPAKWHVTGLSPCQLYHAFETSTMNTVIMQILWPLWSLWRVCDPVTKELCNHFNSES